MYLRLLWQFLRGIAKFAKGLLRIRVILLLVPLVLVLNWILLLLRGNESHLAPFDISSRNVTTRLFPSEERKEVNYAELWKQIDSVVGNDTLYPETYDVDAVLMALRNAKVLHADLMLVTTSYKWVLTLEGGHKAIFKPQIVPKSQRFQHCFKFHCEHPEYEITAFTLNRMLGLRNMPYTTGRVLSWWNEVLPVATPRLAKQYRNVTQNGTTPCAVTACNCQHERYWYCFHKGLVPGAIMYFLDDKVNIFLDEGSAFFNYKIAKMIKDHDGNETEKNLDRLPGDKSYCMTFRKKVMYREDRWFADVTDISILDFLLSHADSSHTYIRRHNGEVLNVMVDFGRAFCVYPEHLRILAPVTQCCKIRKRVYDSLVKHRHNLLEEFEALTQSDPMHPLLQPDLRDIVSRRHAQILSLMDYCIALTNLTDILMDV